MHVACFILVTIFCILLRSGNLMTHAFCLRSYRHY